MVDLNELMQKKAEIDDLFFQLGVGTKFSAGTSLLISDNQEAELVTKLKALLSLESSLLAEGTPNHEIIIPLLDFHLKVANFYAGRQNFPRAAEHLRRVLEFDAGNLTALSALAIMAFYEGNKGLALNYLDEAIKRNKQDPRVYARVAIGFYMTLELESGDEALNTAIEMFNTQVGKAGSAVETHPQQVAFLGTLLESCLYRGEINTALQFTERILPGEIPPGTDPDLLLNMGVLALQVGQYDYAAEKFQDVVNSPDAMPTTKANAYVNLGQIAILQKQDIPQAVQLTEKGLEINPSNPPAWQNLALMYAQLQKPIKSFECFKKAIDIYERFDKREQKLELAMTYNWLVETYFSTRNFQEDAVFEESLDYLQKAIQVAPNLLFSYLNAILVFDMRGNQYMKQMEDILQDMESLEKEHGLTYLAGAVVANYKKQKVKKKLLNATREWFDAYGAGLPARYQQLLPQYINALEQSKK